MSVVIAIPEMGNDLFRKYMKSKYTAALRRAGAEYKWIDLSDPSAAAKEACACDGLLLPGGSDVEPSLYGQERTEKCGAPNMLRDNAEPLMLRAFLKTEKPVLAICRGLQVMNVALGGTLYQDIKDRQQAKHSDFLRRGRTTHSISIEQDSLLYSIVKSAETAVNSLHHQAIAVPANTVRVTANSGDGFIEAVELKDYGFCLGVQWHPEHMSKHSASQQNIFNCFANECKKGK